MIEDLLIQILQAINPKVYRQGSVGEYPDSFFTFWCQVSTDGNHYDNEEICTIETFYIFAYSTDPATTYKMIKDARKALKQNGFIVPGVGYDVMSDEETHTGRGIDAIFMNYNKDDEDEETEETNETENKQEEEQ